ncbi:hypothetical protein [Mycobacterium sp. UM_CSW]|uniref:hypothetical protein n=1 Tax=Mycobacterium sp. UM_CSW TaxID=1370119 RepID=UPI000835B520|nr:hypothetical protein [Mycobacterium sp. UM_CSW]
MSIPDGPTAGSFRLDPAADVWTLVRELVAGQRRIAEIEQMLTAAQAEPANDVDEMLSLSFGPKNDSDLAMLKALWYQRTLPKLIAQLGLALEVHEAFGDPIDAARGQNTGSGSSKRDFVRRKTLRGNAS